MALEWDVCSFGDVDPSIDLSDGPNNKIDMDDDLAELWENLDSQTITTDMAMDSVLINSTPDSTDGPSSGPCLSDTCLPDACLTNHDTETNGEPENSDQWLNMALEPPQPTVVNDCLFSSVNATTDKRPHIKSEHSYSLHGQRRSVAQPALRQESDFGLIREPVVSTDTLSNVTISDSQHLVTVKREKDGSSIKQEPTLCSSFSASSAQYTISSRAPARVSRPSTVLVRPCSSTAASGTPTIVVATSRSLLGASQVPGTQVLIPRNTTVKVESLDCGEEALGLPLTPPGSSGSCSSDSESGSGPSSPQHPLHHGQYGDGPHSSPTPYPNFSPISASGLLLLSEEEKRTLVQEGYPVPSKLPLTKQEERNLKKIRRKIKNKISAQESRRKKKEYLESLEKKVEAYSQDNHELRRKVDNLENNNKSLLTQLHKLQALVRGRGALPSSTTASTGLMVMVLFFAVFLGTWAPSSFSLGYGPAPASPLGSERPHIIPVLPGDRLPLPTALQAAPSDPSLPSGEAPAISPSPKYTTHTARSRLLLSYREEDEYTTLYVPWGPYPAQPYYAASQVYKEPDQALTAETAELAPQARSAQLSLEGSEDWMLMRPDVVADLDPSLLASEFPRAALNATA